MSFKNISTIAVLWISSVGLTANLQSESAGPRLILQDDHSVVIADGSGSTVFSSEFLILYRSDDPQLAVRPGRVPGISYSVATWYTGEATDEVIGGAVDLSRTMGDGWDPTVLAGDQEGRTADYLNTAPSIRLQADKAIQDGKQIIWEYPANDVFELSAMLQWKNGQKYPKLSVEFTPLRDGYYSVGYSGAPAVDPDEADESFQPPLWTRNYFPDISYMTLAFRNTLPTVLVTRDGRTHGLIADPDMMPFEPLPMLDNSHYGVVLRNNDGKAQPMLFAPVLGGLGSKMEAGEHSNWNLYLASKEAPLYDTFSAIAEDLYQVKDYRTNHFVSLNETLRNMIAYGLSDYSRFNTDLRGSSYETDVPGTVNNVTPLMPMSVAYAMDEEAIYWDRVLPMIEAGISRTRRLFTTDPDVRGQGAVHTLNGPNIKGSELAGLYQISGNRLSSFLTMAQKSPSTIAANYALYSATGDQGYWLRALQGAGLRANAYLNEPARDFHRVGFWTSWSPWMLMQDLYERSGEELLKNAALEGLKEYAQFIYAAPVIPEGDITVNKGGEVPLYWYMASQGKTAMQAAEETIPAWRTSEIGLTSESSATSYGHRAIFMANHAPWMLRLGHLAGDSYLQAMARSAVIGRYENFPGYHINTGRTNVYEKADYPLRDHMDLSYNSFHYNHVWPHISFLLDYLVSDANVLSQGKIEFPSVFAEGYAYMENRAFYHSPGKVYGEPAYLWMPLDLLETDQVEFNWIAARYEDAIYLIVKNQSYDEKAGSVHLNHKRTGTITNEEASLLINGKEVSPLPLDNGSLQLTVPGRGIAVVKLIGAKPKVTFQQKLGSGRNIHAKAPLELEDEDGQMNFISVGESLDSIYLFVRDFSDKTQQLDIRYRTDANATWATLSDHSYPFEFTINVSPDDEFFEFQVIKTNSDGAVREYPPRSFKLWE